MEGGQGEGCRVEWGNLGKLLSSWGNLDTCSESGPKMLGAGGKFSKSQKALVPLTSGRTRNLVHGLG